MYVTDVGSRKSNRTNPPITPKIRRSLRPSSPPPPFSPNCNDDSRSLIELPMESLLVAIGAHDVPAGEAYQIRGGARAVNRTHQVGRAIDSPPVARLAEPDAHWCEMQYDDVEEG